MAVEHRLAHWSYIFVGLALSTSFLWSFACSSDAIPLHKSSNVPISFRNESDNANQRGRVLVLPMLNSSHTIMLSAVASELARRAHHVVVLWPRESKSAAVTNDPALKRIEFSIGNKHPAHDTGEKIFLLEQEAVGNT